MDLFIITVKRDDIVASIWLIAELDFSLVINVCAVLCPQALMGKQLHPGFMAHVITY